MPVWTTAELKLDVGAPVSASTLPLMAASVHAGKATLFLVNGGIARQTIVKVIGERDGVLYVDPAVVAAGASVVTEGRTVLSDADAIAATTQPWSPEPAKKP
jgi:hypothetical protein